NRFDQGGALPCSLYITPAHVWCPQKDSNLPVRVRSAKSSSRGAGTAYGARITARFSKTRQHVATVAGVEPAALGFGDRSSAAASRPNRLQANDTPPLQTERTALVLIAPGASARCRKTTRLRGWLERIETEGWIYLRLMKSQPSPAYLWQTDVFRPTPLMGRSHINVAAGMVTCLMAIISEARPVEM